MRPVIGIVARSEENENGTSMLYTFESIRQSIIHSGGEPLLLLPPQDLDYYKTRIKDYPEFTIEEEKRMLKWLNMCDGILLPGGYKMTNFDRYVVEYAAERDVPILGICLGMQVLSCYKKEIEIVPIDENHINHKQGSQEGLCHRVDIEKDNLLYDILKKDSIMVNSFHTKQVTPNKHYEVIAYSEDGIIEAIQNKKNTFNLGVQWHPEKNYLNDENSEKIMNAFVQYSKNRVKINK